MNGLFSQVFTTEKRRKDMSRQRADMKDLIRFKEVLETTNIVKDDVKMKIDDSFLPEIKKLLNYLRRYKGNLEERVLNDDDENENKKYILITSYYRDFGFFVGNIEAHYFLKYLIENDLIELLCSPKEEVGEKYYLIGNFKKLVDEIKKVIENLE
jgi:hypothetical protein